MNKSNFIVISEHALSIDEAIKKMQSKINNYIYSNYLPSTDIKIINIKDTFYVHQIMKKL